MKKLKQEDFSLVLLKDLGTKYPTTTSKMRKRYGLFLCPVCNEPFDAQIQNVKNGKTTKCRSCATSLAQTKHGEAGISKLYSTWKNMRQRCYNKKNKNFMHYGGRGIEICEMWDDYVNFRDWALDNGYSKKLSIDRINPDGDYTPTNCRWTNQTIQSRNTSVLGKTKYKGVYYRKDTEKYRAIIGVNNKQITLGQFNLELDAVKAYNNYVIEHSLEHTLNNIKE